MYYLEFALILLSAIVEIYKKKQNKGLFNMLYLIMTLMVIFRYGQGQDYFAYMYNYYHDFSEWTSVKEVLLRSDPGYYLLAYGGYRLNIKFEVFSAIVGGVTMSLFYKALAKRNNYSIIGLLFFYCLVWFIYVLSGIRQELAMAVWVCFAMQCLKNGKWWGYYIFTALAVSFHASAAIFLFIPLLYRIKSRNILTVIVIISFVLSFVGMPILSRVPFIGIDDRVGIYYTQRYSIVFYLARILRIILIIPVIVVLGKSKDASVDNICKLVIFLTFVYALLSFSELVSGRVWGYAIMVFPFFISQTNFSFTDASFKNIISIYYIAIVSVLFFNNIQHSIDWGNYYDTNMFTYPYISIFDKTEVNRIMYHELNI